MRKTKKSRILSLVLCMSMIISTFAFVPGLAYAENTGAATAAETKSFKKMTVEEQFEYLKSLDSDDEVEKAVKSLSDKDYKALENYINEKAKENAEKNPPKTVTFTDAGPFLPAVNVTKQNAKKAKRANALNANESGSSADDGLNLSKTVTKNSDGTYKISLEAYTTGKVTTSTKTSPVDIVLVLDQSGSMAYDFNGKSTSNVQERRQYAMKQAVNSFIEAVSKKYSTEADHRISVVTFGTGASTLQGWTTVDEAGKDTLQTKINKLNSPSGATNVGAGMQAAETLMGSDSYEGKNIVRQKVVIVFTDGVPTTASDFDTGVANTAISSAKNLKDAGCTVYSIGIFKGANPEELYGASGFDKNSDGSVGSNWSDFSVWMIGDVKNYDVPAGNRFLNYLSNNFTATDKIGIKNYKRTILGIGYYGWEITKNFDRTKTGYYLTADDSEGLNSIFKTISEQIQTSDIDLGSKTVIRDIVADQFNMPSGTENMTVKSVACTGYKDGEPQWGTETPITNGISIDQANKAVNVTGFDFNNNFVSEKAKTDGTHGSKLVIEFDISVKDGFLGGNDVKTNGDKSGVYENGESQTPVKKFEQPTVDIPIKEISVTAPDKNIYLLGSVSQDELKAGISAKTTDNSKVTFDLSKPNYGLEDWQTAYVDLTVSAKDSSGKDIFASVYSEMSNLRDDVTYTVNAEIKAKGAEEGNTASAIGKINVFKPELKYKDSTVYYGDTAPTRYNDNKVGETVWKHGDTILDESISIIGEAPDLALSYSPATYSPAIESEPYYKDGKIATKQDIPVKATVKIGDTDVTQFVAFKHQDCSSSCGFDKANEQFLIHVKTCSLTVTKTGGVTGEPYVMYIYKDGEPYTSMTIVGNSSETISETIRELPVGTYTVREDTDWAWRYKTPGPNINPEGVGLNKGNASGEITVTNQNRYQSFLNGYSDVVKNIFDGSKSN